MEEIKSENQIIRDLLEENIRLTKEIQAYNAKIKKYIFIRTIISIIWIFIILAPIVFAIIWLPPFLKGYVGDFSDLLKVIK
ncbi:MAG: hypothetical protein WCV92_04310 [Candidatus Buchananbacteria bacterium]